jgi:3-oxoacyl-(acyl-carrier-protein) synthase
MNRRRVKITGLGFVTPAGTGKEAFKEGILQKKSRVSVVSRFPPESGEYVASEVHPFEISRYFPDGTYRRIPRHTQFALAATKLALTDSGITGALDPSWNPVVVTGTSLMDSDTINKTIENATRRGPRYALSRVIFQAPVAAISATIADYLGSARTLTLQSACCSGSDAIGHAAALVANGESDIAICGGTEAPIFYHPMLELRMAGLSPASSERPDQLSRPFDLWRTTGVVGEGACIMVLEPESSPRPGYAFVSGYSFASDSGDDLGGGLSTSIFRCLANARIHTSEVDMISAWGPGHREIDAAEARALWRVFGSKVLEIPTVSIKGAIGNPFAAAGAIQAGCAAMGIRDSFIPPTVNWRQPDPSCRLNLSSDARHVRVRTALINSHGLSGTNSALLLEDCT